MRLEKMHWTGIIVATILLILDFAFFFGDKNMFTFLIGLASTSLVAPFVIGLALENKRQREIDDMFLEFSRNLAESVNTGTPISKSIINMSKKNYGPLTPYVQKLANQISLGIPVGKALENFSYDVESPVISRAVVLIREAERAGGQIDYILESVAKSIAEVDKLRRERKAAISNLVVQGYIIFFIFIGIMLVMEFKIIPMTASSGLGVGGFDFFNNARSLDSINTASNNAGSPADDLAMPFLYLLVVQGFFTGLTIGKLSEGTIKAGVKHSFILAITALLVSTGARVLF